MHVILVISVKSYTLPGKSRPPRQNSFRLSFSYFPDTVFLDIITQMSYYFAIIGTKDAPIYNIEFGTYRQGGDGSAKV